MPQLDVLIWMNLVLTTTICFWGIYYLLIRLFLLNYQFILNLRLKFKNSFFNLVYVILILLFNYNFQNIKTIVKYKNFLQKKNHTHDFFFVKSLNLFYILLNILTFNVLFERIHVGNFMHQFYYFLQIKK